MVTLEITKKGIRLEITKGVRMIGVRVDLSGKTEKELYSMIESGRRAEKVNSIIELLFRQDTSKEAERFLKKAKDYDYCLVSPLLVSDFAYAALDLLGFETYAGKREEVKLLIESLNNINDYDTPVMSDQTEYMGDMILSNFYKKHKNDSVWWISDLTRRGPIYFSFDRKIVFNIYSDYPYKLTKEQIRVFDNENPFWADYFKSRKKEL